MAFFIIINLYRLAALFSVSFMPQKPSFSSVNSICYSFKGEDITDLIPSYVYSSLWENIIKQDRFVRPNYMFTLIMLLSGDIELNPGPPDQCNACSKRINKNQRKDLCHLCKISFHLKCLKSEIVNGNEKLLCSNCFIVNVDDNRDGIPSPYTELNVLLTKRGLKLFHQNVNGLLNKHAEVEIMMQETKRNIHIFGISETHLSSDIPNDQIHLDQYSIIRKDRSTGLGGGVACYIRDDIEWIRRNDIENSFMECIWIEVNIKLSRSILICILYRPPDSSKHLSPKFNGSFSECLSNIASENKEIVIMGDLNVDFLKKSSNKAIREILLTNGLKQVIEFATRTTSTSKTLIDIIATTHEDNICKQIVIGNSISDHDLTGVIRKINCKKYTPKIIKARNFSKYDIEIFKQDLSNAPWDHIYNINDVNTAWRFFKSIFLSIVNKNAPIIKKTIRGQNSPWLTNDIKTSINERNHHLKIARRTKLEKDWIIYRKSRNATTQLIKNRKANYHRNVFYENINKPNAFWKCIKSCYNTKNNSYLSHKSFIIENETSTCKSKIAASFCRYFTNIGSILKNSIVTLNDKIWTFHNPYQLNKLVNPMKFKFKFRKVSNYDTFLIVKKLNCSKAYGQDMIPPSLVKDAISEICKPLTHLINLSFSFNVSI